MAFLTGRSGYTFASVVTISGGRSTGASAVINGLSGTTITGIRSTNPVQATLPRLPLALPSAPVLVLVL